jgi:hypothetical protein
MARTHRVRMPIFMTLTSIAIAFAVISGDSAIAENPDIRSRRASERTDFTNDEIKDGFFKIAFKAELQRGYCPCFLPFQFFDHTG